MNITVKIIIGILIIGLIFTIGIFLSPYIMPPTPCQYTSTSGYDSGYTKGLNSCPKPVPTTCTNTPSPWVIGMSAAGNTVPLRYGSNGSIECSTTDGKSCVWGNTIPSSTAQVANCGNSTFKATVDGTKVCSYTLKN